MNKPSQSHGILVGTAKTGLQLLGMIPVGIARALTPSGKPTEFINRNIHDIRLYTGAAVAAAIGFSILD